MAGNTNTLAGEGLGTDDQQGAEVNGQATGERMAAAAVATGRMATEVATTDWVAPSYLTVDPYDAPNCLETEIDPMGRE